MTHIQKSGSGVALLVSSLGWVHQAAAAPDQGIALEEIVITAQRQESNLQNTPIAVTAVSGEALTQRGASSLLDVQNFTPSLTVNSRSTAGTTQGGFAIRGIGVDSTSSSAAVGLYVDEVYYPSGAANILGLFDVERIEVLRGPQGTLFGRNTIAGAVQYITNKPTQDFGGFVSVTAGNLGRYNYSGALNIPLGNTLAVRISGQDDREGGFVRDQLSGDKRGQQDTKQGRIAIRWQPTSTLTVDLKGEAVNLQANGRAISLLAFNTSLTPPLPGAVNPGAALVFAAIGSGLNPAAIFGIKPSSNNYTFQGFNAEDSQNYHYSVGQGEIAWDLTDALKLKSITAFSLSHDNQAIDIDDTIVPILGGTRGNIVSHLFTQELQLVGTALHEALKFTVGLYYSRDNQTNENQGFTFGPSPLLIPTNAGDLNNKDEAKAAYGQFTYQFTDAFSATVGMRYSKETVTASFLNTAVPNPGSPGTPLILPASIAPLSNSFSNTSPHFGLNYQVDADTLLYASASRGFRAGGITANGNLLNPAPPLPAITSTPGYIPFDEETAWTEELGARMQFLNRRLRINPTLFYTDWKNIQFNTFVFNPNPNVITRNAGNARLYGAELEAQAAVTDHFQLNASYSYLTGKYTQIDPGIDAKLSDELQHTPKNKFSVGGVYTLPLANGNSVVASADYAYTAHQRSATTDSDFITLPSYGLLNARLVYQFLDSHLSIALYGKNLLDKYYYIGGINGYGTFGAVEGDLGRPREYGATLKYTF